MSTADAVAGFSLVRAEVLGEGLRGPFVESSTLRPPIPAATLQPIQGSLLYTTTDSSAAGNTRYVYRLDVLGAEISVIERETADSPPIGDAPRLSICDPTSTTPTVTPTHTVTPVVFPTITPTSSRTPTPTWTPTPTITPTPTWTPTGLPTPTATASSTSTYVASPPDTPGPATDTPVPTATITPTNTPDIQPPTSQANGAPETNASDPPPPDPEQPTLTPTPEPSPTPTLSPAPQATDTPTPTPTPTQATAAGDEAFSLEELVAAVEEELAEDPPTASEFRPRLIPQGQARLLRFGLLGVAGLGLLGALAFLLAGIGLRRR